ncbi:unnamed protein product [Allacma fusca]|uniref:Uncharacterized protein n=1 Tax=Allacma fusca TaxID=39272 RepID=A0A8J2JCP3_9HEXA|nr:unnamed protein product [Allacma fusca]
MLHNFVIYALVLISTVRCSEEIKKAVDDATCKGHDIDVSEEDMGVILECASELGMKSKNDINMEKMPCFSRCLIEKQGLVDHDGNLHKEKILDLDKDSNLPQALKEDIRKHLGACLDEHGPTAKADDKSCKSFEPLTVCIHKAYLHVCAEA